MGLKKFLYVLSVLFSLTILASCSTFKSSVSDTTEPSNSDGGQIFVQTDNLSNTFESQQVDESDSATTSNVGLNTASTTVFSTENANVSQTQVFTTSNVHAETTGNENSSSEKNFFASVKYGEHDKNIMDIFVPESAYDRKENSCILFIHGGSWTGGEKSEMTSRCQEYTEKGYITATMDYRLYVGGSDVTVIKMLEDIDNAIKALKSFSEKKKLNITKLATSGYSAGAHLSMLYTYANTNENRADELKFIKPAIPIVFTANQVGPSDFRAGVWGVSESGDTGIGLGELLSGIKLTEVVDGKTVVIADDKTLKYALELVSPSAQVTSSAVPSIFGYGGKDYVVPIGNKDSIVRACENAGVKYDLVMYPKSGHMLMFDSKSAKQYTKLLDDYCLTYFEY